MPGVNIQAPNLRAPRVSILTAAEVIQQDGDAWWGGIEVLPLSAKGAGTLYNVCTNEDPKGLAPTLNGQRFQPFVIIASDNCSTFGYSATDFADRARQKLSVIEPYELEKEIWGGAFTTNPSFSDANNVSVGSSLNPLGGFALVDAAVANDPGDGRGMIHMNSELFDLLQTYNLFRREGNVWFSPNDNVVLPGQGYPDDDYRIIGHVGTILIVRSDVIVFGDDFKQGVNRQTNDIRVLAERVVGYVFSAGFENNEPDTVSGEFGFYYASVDPELVPGGAGDEGGGGSESASAYTVSTPVAADNADFDDATAYLGFSFKNNSGAVAATVSIHNGDSNAGDILDIVELGPGESRSEWYSPGIATPGGIFVDVTAGALTANSTVRYRTS